MEQRKDDKIKMMEAPKKVACSGSALNVLLCCPCCGSKQSKSIKGFIDKRKIWQIYCPACQVRTGPEYTLKQAKEVWNKRA